MSLCVLSLLTTICYVYLLLPNTFGLIPLVVYNLAKDRDALIACLIGLQHH